MQLDSSEIEMLIGSIDYMMVGMKDVCFGLLFDCGHYNYLDSYKVLMKKLEDELQKRKSK